MRTHALAAATAALFGAAAPALAQTYAADAVEFDTILVRLDIITEDRADVSVSLEAGGGQVAPPSVAMNGSTLEITGERGYRVRECRSEDGDVTMRLAGGDAFAITDLPKVTVRMPSVAGLEMEDATVFGAIGDVREADLELVGCSTLALASAEELTLLLNGSGDVTTGSVGTADVTLNGSGDLTLAAITGALDVELNGSGDVNVDLADGALDLMLNGSGDIDVSDGRASDFDANVNGSGDIRFGGVAVDPRVAIYGSGDIRIQALEGNLRSTVHGSGDIRIGR